MYRIVHCGVVFWACITLLQIHSTTAAAGQEKSKVDIVPQAGHSSQVTAAAYAPNGKLIVSGGMDNAVKIWEGATGRIIRTLTGHSQGITSVCFSHDGRLILSASFDYTARLWDAATGNLLRTMSRHSGSLVAAVFSPDDRTLVTASHDGTLIIWGTENGSMLRNFKGHTDEVTSIAYAPDGQSIISGSRDKTIKIWETNTAKLIRTLNGHSDWVSSVAFSPNGHSILSGGADGSVRVWAFDSSRQIKNQSISKGLVEQVGYTSDGSRYFEITQTENEQAALQFWDTETGTISSTHYLPGRSKIALSPSGQHVLAIGSDANVEIWNIATAALENTLAGRETSVHAVAYSSDGSQLATAATDEVLRIWNAFTGRPLRALPGHAGHVVSIAFDRREHYLAAGTGEGPVMLWDTRTGQLVRTLKGHLGRVNSVAFSVDGDKLLTAADDDTLKVWHLANGKLIRTIAVQSSVPGDGETITRGIFIGNGRLVASWSWTSGLKLWEIATGKLVRTFKDQKDVICAVAASTDGRIILSGGQKWLKWWDAATGALLRSVEAHGDFINSLRFSHNDLQILSAGDDGVVRLWDASTGELVKDLERHSSPVKSATFSPDNSRVASVSTDGMVRIETRAGLKLADLLVGSQGQWLVMSGPGFFDIGPNFHHPLSLVRKFEVTSVDQVYRSLFNPDLVRESLAGDPDDEVKRAAEVSNVGALLDSGPAPTVEIISAQPPSSGSDLVNLTVKIVDMGRGIGRIEWRVNGVTAAVSARPEVANAVTQISQSLALDPGDNTIEVVAYNSSNLLASLPAHRVVKRPAAPDIVKPKFYALLIGINGYADPGWRQPGSEVGVRFPPLELAVGDAVALGEALKSSASGHYSSVHIALALDGDASSVGLERRIEHIAKEIHPRDTFVLFAAGHGASENGRFYFIPQDYHSGPRSLETKAIDQDRLQEWVANKIKAKKAVILLDTCASGALVGGFKRSRTDIPASEAAVGRLHEATGRPVLTAAAEGRPAFEGYEGHGVFTWAVLDALKHGDRDGNGTIELSELVSHVQDVVPTISAKLNGRGRAAVGFRGSNGDRQSARYGSRGEDFTIVQQLR